MNPSVGRIVHYVSRGSADGVFTPQCRAAIITEIGADQNTGHEGFVSLAVLNPQGMFFDWDVRYEDVAQGQTGGTWHWPERVE
jgi:hypothetical protein